MYCLVFHSTLSALQVSLPRQRSTTRERCLPLIPPRPAFTHTFDLNIDNRRAEAMHSIDSIWSRDKSMYYKENISLTLNCFAIGFTDANKLTASCLWYYAFLFDVLASFRVLALLGVCRNTSYGIYLWYQKIWRRINLKPYSNFDIARLSYKIKTRKQ